MKLFRFGLNLWITAVSLLTFLLGWVALAHSPKPVQPQSQAAISQSVGVPTLAPLDNLQFGDNGNTSSAPQFGFSNNFNSAPQPVFRTGGS